MGTLIRVVPSGAHAESVPAYAELKARTHYSFLRGAAHPREMMEQAQALGLHSLAITDCNGVYGIPKAFVAEKTIAQVRAEGASSLAPVAPLTRLITGSELTLEGGMSLTVLARDRAAYGLLCRLITAVHADKPKGEGFLRWDEWWALTHQYKESTRGLLILPDWRLGGPELPWGDLGDAFGPSGDLASDALSIPLPRWLDGLDRARTEWAHVCSRRYRIPIVAINDAHTHLPAKQPLQDLLTAVREIIPLSEIGTRVHGNAERTLKSPAQMARLFRDLPEALHRTVEWAERCTFSPRELRYQYPSEWIPAGESAQSYLEHLVREGARKRYPAGVPADVTQQLAHELGLIAQLGFADYFLTIWEIVAFARSRQILCQGRGSAANSIVCYCLEITAIDPVRMSLLFERFISVERGEPPDIDVDFEHERREEVIQHIYTKYGRDRAGMVSAIITYREKSSLRDLAKALSVEPAQLEEPPLAHFLEEIKGFPRHLSIHSGGFTLSADPIIETVPIEPARMEGRTIVQWDKEDLDAVGLLKVDVLALGMLTAIRRTLDLVHQTRGQRMGLADIPAEDPATYAMIQEADTVGVFQIESRAQMNMLRRLRPRTFYDLVIQVAIVRPGPIMGEMVHPYLRRRRGQEPAISPDPRLDPILARTLGVPLFQEQVMKIAIVLANFTPGEADELRRAIAAWRSSGHIERLGKRLMEGLLAQGLPTDWVERIFKQIQGFSEYGFPESHAASFGLLAYISSYLKCHYPAEFLVALMNSQPMGFYADHTLIEDAQRHGVKVLPLDVNHSQWECTMEGLAVRVGFKKAHGLREVHAKALIAEREANGEFRGLGDLVSRGRLPLRVLHSLAMGDAFRSFGYAPREALWQLLRLRAEIQNRDGELPLFQQLVDARASQGGGQPPTPSPRFAPLTRFQAIQGEFHAYGLSTQGHPLSALREELARTRRPLPSLTSQAVKRQPQNKRVQIAGLIICRQRPQTANNTVFATLEDEEGFIDLILHEAIYEKYRATFVEMPFLTITGRLQRDVELPDKTIPPERRSMSVIVERVAPISGVGEVRTHSHDFH